MRTKMNLRSGAWRSRWAAIGAAVAVTLGAGGMVAVNAAPSAPSSFVAITPTRILDTRTDVGLAGPFVSGVAQKLKVTGVVPTQPPGGAAPVSQEVVPPTATSVVFNVTVVRPSTKGFLSVRPGDATGTPATSNINWAAGGANIANAVTVQLPASGTIDIYVNGTVGHVLVDVAGFNIPITAGPSGPPGPAGSDGAPGPANRITDEQIALLQWYEDTGAPTTFSGFVDPWAVATDGSNIWVVNRGFPTGSVSKLDPATGTKIDYPVGGLPQAIAFDGTNMWVTNQQTDNVSRINATTGAKVDFPADNGPIGIAYDGTSIWIANASADTVSKMNPETGSKVDYPVGSRPDSVAFDGQFIWVVNQQSSDVWKINPATGAKVADYQSGSGGGLPRAVLFDGANLWTSNTADFNVSRIDPATGSKTDFEVPFAPFGLAYDGSHIWIANSGDPGTVSKMDPVLGTTVEYPTGAFPTGVAFDGTNIWVASAGDGTLTKLLPGS